ncbi:glyoxylate/hydroxypyruvate reductase A [Kaistia dalseonensis]|uniref:Glyoxylate/hydroxypyruvate reductase A n=1 Tax=Kaistia dalseonensis TaxID=410840 RepID=A0ABU0HAQ2_9HYPH|nr:glyoxylate/hydroxypyruvate reductase A [Kaistia dalseonensis]MCX5496324.1 glyoxylate/hydroxypyruvate reductase A [Kaistia dalseonensis]MDQ0438943.1 glyoxylate/hydroxypyruvate reductase A [Kaistia dalseonensis]
MTKPNSLPGVLIASGAWDPEPWAAPFRPEEPARPIRIWPDVPDPESIHYVLAWKSPAEVFANLPNLKAVFSLGAGVDHIIGVAGLPDVPIVRVVDPDLTTRMTEWVVLQVLLHHRHHLAYARQQAAHLWKDIRQPVASAVRVGIMGFGALGQASADILSRIGFQVAGWSRTAKQADGIETFHGEAGLTPFLNRTDILVVLLPLTPETRGILNRRLFAELARDGVLGGPILINGGRGGLQVGADILSALDDGTLIAASLDVFEPEPLPADSPFWGRPNVIITPHVAASSEASVLADGIHRHILAFEAGKPLANLVDRQRQY